MRKNVFISFIALATALILLSGAVPHHHHGGVACLIMERCEEDGSVNDEHTDHSACNDTHHEQSCIAESNYILAADSRIKCKVSSCDHGGSPDHVHFFPVLYLAADFLLHLPEPANTKTAYGEYITLYPSTQASCIHGLRAPPAFA